MIKLFRNKHVQKQIYIVLAVAVVITFLVSGIIISQDSRSSSALGVIDHKKISAQDYLAAYKAVDREAKLIYGDNYQRARSMVNFKGEAWDRILLLDYAKKQKLRCSDDEVVRWIGSQKGFYSQGQFDDRLYKLYLSQYLQVDPTEFEEEMRQFLTIGKINDQIRSGLSVSDDELKKLYDQENGERDIQYVSIPWESEKNNVTVKESDLKQIYPIIKDKLTEPEKVKLKYIFIPKENLGSQAAALAEKELSVEEVSKKYTLPVHETSYFSKNDSVPEIGLSEKILLLSFSLPQGKTSEWVDLEKGVYKIEVADKKSERTLNFEEAQETLKNILVKEEASKLAVKKLQDLKKKIAGQDFEKALAAEGVQAQKFEKLKKDSYVPGIGPGNSLERSLEKVKEGEISDAFSTPTGAALVKILPARGGNNSDSDATGFAKDKEEFKKKVLDKKSHEEMGKLLEKLRNKLQINLEIMKQIFPEEK